MPSSNTDFANLVSVLAAPPTLKTVDKQGAEFLAQNVSAFVCLHDAVDDSFVDVFRQTIQASQKKCRKIMFR
jgi:hypothetical protein